MTLNNILPFVTAPIKEKSPIWQTTAIIEYDKPLVRRLIEKVTVYENKFTVELYRVTVDVNR